MSLPALIGIGLLIAVVGIVVHVMLEEKREICSFCGKSSCDGEHCPRRAAWEQREREAVFQRGLVTSEPQDDLRPWREFVDTL